MWWVTSQVWLNSASNELSQSRKVKCLIESELNGLNCLMSQSRVSLKKYGSNRTLHKSRSYKKRFYLTGHTKAKIKSKFKFLNRSQNKNKKSSTDAWRRGLRWDGVFYVLLSLVNTFLLVLTKSRPINTVYFYNCISKRNITTLTFHLRKLRCHARVKRLYT